jgi:prepilin-type N-terminal cleavage/methylation domain-containing protein
VIVRFLSVPGPLFRSCAADPPSGRDSRFLPLFSGLQLNFLKRTSANARGYTLIELIVVIVLLGLMFGLTVPKFRQAVLSDRLDATSLRIIGLVADLREKAISDQVSYVLHFDLREKTLWSFAATASEEEQEEARERAYQLSADVNIEDIWSWSRGKLYEEATIHFSKKGYIEQSMIHLQAEDGRQLSLELTPFLGSIKIHEGYVDFDRG